MLLFKQYLSSPVEAVVKARVALPKETVEWKEGFLTSFAIILSCLLKRFATDDSIATVEVHIRNLKQRSLMEKDYAWQIWGRRLRCGSVCNGNVFSCLFVDDVRRSICQIIFQWCLSIKKAYWKTTHRRTHRLLTFNKACREVTSTRRSSTMVPVGRCTRTTKACNHEDVTWWISSSCPCQCLCTPLHGRVQQIRVNPRPWQCR